MNEFELIKEISRIVRRSNLLDKRVIVGIGDDAAVIAPNTKQIVVTTDTLVEGVHFRFDLCSYDDAGWRAAAANLSDLAAMGAEPIALLVGLQLPDGFEHEAVLRVMRGFTRLCRICQTQVVGGNICVAQGPLALAVTAIGEVHTSPLLRSGARPKDLVFVSGALGSAALGLRLLAEYADFKRQFAPLVKAWRHPRPRIELGKTLSKISGVHAAIDISDGLLQDLGHILEASHVGAVLDVERVPLTRTARRFGVMFGIDPLEMALSGGDDYELIVCADKALEGELRSLGLTAIGEVIRRREFVLNNMGQRISMPDFTGFRHL